MRIAFDTELTTLDGKPIPNGPGPDAESVCLRDVAVASLLNMPEAPGSLPAGDVRLLRGRLARKLFGARAVDLSPEDVVLLKSLIGQTYGPLIVMQAYELFDPVRCVEVVVVPPMPEPKPFLTGENLSGDTTLP